MHTPLAKDNIEQPHLHLMFSERIVDENTQALAEDRFFKRNGAKKDPDWNRQKRPYEVRETWVAMMNAAMERHGQEQRLDARSWADQGRHDLAELVEPKLLGGDKAEARQLQAQVDGLREQRAELPPIHLSPAAAVEQIKREAEKAVAAVEQRQDRELGLIDKLIERARELAAEVKERTVAAARNVAERVESFFSREKEMPAALAREQEQARPSTLSAEERLEQKVEGLDRKLAAQASLETRLAGFEQRMDTQLKVQEQQQEKEIDKQQEIKQSRGFEIGR